MFLNQLTDRQKGSFLALVTKIMLADGEIHASEEAMLGAIKGELGAGVTAPSEEIFGAANTAVFNTRKTRVIVLLELLVMSHADESLHVDEDQVLDEVAGAFGFSEAELAAMRGWAGRQAALLVEARALMGG